MFVKSEQDIREWILYGVPRSQAERHASDGHRTLVPMPSYERELDAGQLEDLVAYVLAVSGWRDEIPDAAYEGRKIATRLGCFGCHGPSGMGGVANPGSYKGHIPPWTGHEYAELVRDEGELREWILEGKIERSLEQPACPLFHRPAEDPDAGVPRSPFRCRTGPVGGLYSLAACRRGGSPGRTAEGVHGDWQPRAVTTAKRRRLRLSTACHGCFSRVEVG